MEVDQIFGRRWTVEATLCDSPFCLCCAFWTDRVRSFLNRISGKRQADEPPPFYGGIIADPMGLGKTLTMIALIASDTYNPALREPSVPGGVVEKACGTTLVIVPPACKGEHLS